MTTLSLPEQHKQLIGPHTNVENAHVNNFFPFCYGQFTTMRSWVETNIRHQCFAQEAFNTHTGKASNIKYSKYYNLVLMIQHEKTGIVAPYFIDFKTLAPEEIEELPNHPQIKFTEAQLVIIHNSLYVHTKEHNPQDLNIKPSPILPTGKRAPGRPRADGAIPGSVPKPTSHKAKTHANGKSRLFTVPTRTAHYHQWLAAVLISSQHQKLSVLINKPYSVSYSNPYNNLDDQYPTPDTYECGHPLQIFNQVRDARFQLQSITNTYTRVLECHQAIVDTLSHHVNHPDEPISNFNKYLPNVPDANTLSFLIHEKEDAESLLPQIEQVLLNYKHDFEQTITFDRTFPQYLQFCVMRDELTKQLAEQTRGMESKPKAIAEYEARIQFEQTIIAQMSTSTYHQPIHQSTT